ncbi:MAG: TrkA family potassium uptake protein [Eubacteriaceae bacterium]|nr:TrkA family potassium uptake protein [Eubacteriaceae bacterium]
MRSVLLIGMGRFGMSVAKKLNEMNVQVMAVDMDESRISNCLGLVTKAQIGDSTNEAFIASLGVSAYDACILAIGDDFQSSLETACLLKEYGAKKVIARACSDVQEKFLLRNGADEVVFPEKQLGAWTAVRSCSERVLDFFEIGSGCSLFEVAVPEEWVGRNVVDLDVRKRYGINVIGIGHEGHMDMDVGPGRVFGEGDTVLVAGNLGDVQRCFRF